MTHKQRTIELLQRGWLTSLQCAQMGGCLSLSQRIGEFRRQTDMVIDEKWITTGGGARVKAWRIQPITKWTM